jgi:alcohol dehydrogenase (NADP+)
MGVFPFPFSANREQILSNLHAALLAPLTREDMKEIAGIDKNRRLIKSQVFLWKEN